MRKLLLGTILLLSTELWLFLWLTRHIGWWPMLGITLLGGMLGGRLAQRQGRRVFRQWQGALSSGQPPAVGALEGMLLFVSAALFLLPGVLTDVVGLLLLFAPVRRQIAQHLRPLLGFDAWTRGPARTVAPAAARRGEVLDTEGEAVADDEAPTHEQEPTGPRQLH